MYFFRILLWKFILDFYVAIFSCCTVFILHHFLLQFFVLFFMLHCFRVALFLCIALFHVALLNVVMFSFCILLLLHSSHVAILCCWSLFMLHYFQRCSQDTHKHLKWRVLQQQLTKPLNIVAKLSILDVRGGLVTLLLVSCCTFSMLHFFHAALFNIEKYWKWTKDRRRNLKATLPSTMWTCFTLILTSYNTFLSLYSFGWLIKWKGTHLLSFLEKNVYQGLKLLKLGWELKFISTWHKLSSRYFDYNIEN